MSLTTPGLIFVVRGLVNLLIPVAGVYGGLYVLGDVIDLPIPPLTKWIAAICTSPLLAISKSAWARFREAREARKMGATPVPVLNGKWIGNFDILLALKKGFEVGYPGTPCYLCSLIFYFLLLILHAAEAFWPIFDRLGPIVNLRVFGQNQIFTTEPDHIKVRAFVQS